MPNFVKKNPFFEYKTGFNKMLLVPMSLQIKYSFKQINTFFSIQSRTWQNVALSWPISESIFWAVFKISKSVVVPFAPWSLARHRPKCTAICAMRRRERMRVFRLYLNFTDLFKSDCPLFYFFQFWVLVLFFHVEAWELILVYTGVLI